MGESVAVRYTKWGGALHWHFDLEEIGRDAHGVWLAGPPGTPLQLRDEPPVVRRDTFVALVPHEGHWIAFWNEASRFEIYVDVTTAPLWSQGELTAVDLDLDVVRWRADGVVTVLDEDEFLDHQVELAYPPEVIADARSTTAWLVEAVSTGQEPFGKVGAGWLAGAVG